LEKEVEKALVRLENEKKEESTLRTMPLMPAPSPKRKMEYPEIYSGQLPNSWKQFIAPRWGHTLHSICSRTGSFPAKLAHYFISAYSEPNDRVLDLYSGKGTAPLEACLMGRLGIGNDVCPDAYVLTYAKTRIPEKRVLLSYLHEVARRLGKPSTSEVDENVKIYFSEETLRQILAMQEIVNEDSSKEAYDRDRTKYDNSMFLKALMLGILHGRVKYSLSLPCPHSFAMSPNYVRRKIRRAPVKYARPKRDVIECLKLKIEQVFGDPIPTCLKKGKAYQSDAASLELNECVDLIITSPPYLDAHTYAWDNWLRLWFLGHDYKRVRPMLIQTSSEKTYLDHMKKSLKRMYELLKDNARCFIVVGDVKGHTPIAYLLADLIEKNLDVGFTVRRIIKDDIDHNRKYLYGDNDRTGISADRILELCKGTVQEHGKQVFW